MSEKREQWMKEGRYLPQPLRDFHDQKDVFKLMHEFQKLDDNRDMPNWVNGQIYVIDCFLWFMARRGYTLQRARIKLPFQDLNAELEAAERRRTKEFREYLTATKTTP